MIGKKYYGATNPNLKCLKSRIFVRKRTNERLSD